jgi:hypothetical protein
MGLYLVGNRNRESGFGIGGGGQKLGRPVETHTRTGSLTNKIHFFYISFILVLQSVHM